MNPLRISLRTERTPLIEKTLAIISRIVRERCDLPVEVVTERADILLDLQPGIGTEGFLIEDTPDGLRVAGDDERGLLYGVGKLLHGSTYALGKFTPGSWRGVSVPQCSLRGMYFALHNGWYSNAPLDEMARYMEELALWGFNTLAFHLTEVEDPATPGAAAIKARNHAVLAAAKAAGMKVALLQSVNIGFESAPLEIRAPMFPDTDPARRGDAGARICPSNPAGLAYLSKVLDQYLAGYEDLGIDYAVTFPYDAGGCGCADCWPWGARGFVTISKEFYRLAQARYPGCRRILATWCFDVLEEPDGEYDGLARLLAADATWVDALMIDSHYEFPDYPLTHGAPGGLPVINFAEISMWGRFPWGGYGANPLPERFQRIWNESKALLDGGLPYSEGIFEDIDKVIFGQFFWEKDRLAVDALREYIAFEYAPAVVEPVLEAIALLEKNWLRESWQREEVVRAYDILQQVDAQLPAWSRDAWRWRILLLRALSDAEWVTHGELTDRCDAAYEELTRIYHVENGWQCVSPRTRRRLAQQQAAELPPGAELAPVE